MSDEPNDLDAVHKLERMTGLTSAAVRDLVKPLFLAMHKHGIRKIQITKRDGNADLDITTDSGVILNGYGKCD